MTDSQNMLRSIEPIRRRRRKADSVESKEVEVSMMMKKKMTNLLGESTGTLSLLHNTAVYSTRADLHLVQQNESSGSLRRRRSYYRRNVR